MKATEIEKGNVLRESGKVVYTVIWVEEPNHDDQIVAGVRYADGGSGERVWDSGTEVPLTKD